jgi:hypothetical protein
MHPIPTTLTNIVDVVALCVLGGIVSALIVLLVSWSWS